MESAKCKEYQGKFWKTTFCVSLSKENAESVLKFCVDIDGWTCFSNGTCRARAGLSLQRKNKEAAVVEILLKGKRYIVEWWKWRLQIVSDKKAKSLLLPMGEGMRINTGWKQYLEQQAGGSLEARWLFSRSVRCQCSMSNTKSLWQQTIIEVFAQVSKLMGGVSGKKA